MVRFSLNLTDKWVLLLMFFSLCAIPCFAQSNLLDKQISIPNYKGNTKELIEKVGNDEGIVFSFTNEINLNYNVTFTKSKVTLNDFLDSLFANEVQFTPISESDIRKTLIDPLTGVISDERLSQLMPDWKQDAMTAVNWNEQQFSKVLDMAYGQATKDASILNEFNRVEADKMNKFMAEQFYSAMDEGTPGLRSLTGKYLILIIILYFINS